MASDMMCITCLFFVQLDADQVEGEIGYCQRYPPTTSPRVFDPPIAQMAESMLTSSFAAFPLVTVGTWCGEWMRVSPPTEKL